MIISPKNVSFFFLSFLLFLFSFFSLFFALPFFFLAGGGSGYAFQFFPVLGNEIGDVLIGKGRVQEKWGWKKHIEGLGDGSRSGSDGERVRLEELL